MYFREDHWVGKRPLCAVFPHLFHLGESVFFGFLED